MKSIRIPIPGEWRDRWNLTNGAHPLVAERMAMGQPLNLAIINTAKDMERVYLLRQAPETTAAKPA